MTYEEALENIKADICYNQPMCADGVCKSTEENPCAIDIAIEGIEKQISKKPTYTDKKNIYGGKFRTCNECGDEVCISPMAMEYENYCRRCGKRLRDWSDEHEYDY